MYRTGLGEGQGPLEGLPVGSLLLTVFLVLFLFMGLDRLIVLILTQGKQQGKVHMGRI